MTATSEERSEDGASVYVPQWRVCPLHPGLVGCYGNKRCRTDEAKWNNAEHKRRWNSKNPTYHQEWREANKDRKAASNRRWLDENRERYSANQRKWQEANYERVLEIQRLAQHRRRARRLENGVEPYSLDELWAQAEPIDWRCYLCGEMLDSDRWVVEHVLAIARGGSDSLSNVLPAHPRCNGRKSDRMLTDLPWTDHEAVLARLAACGLFPA